MPGMEDLRLVQRLSLLISGGPRNEVSYTASCVFLFVLLFSRISCIFTGVIHSGTVVYIVFFAQHQHQKCACNTHAETCA